MNELRVGDPVRRVAGRAILSAVATSVVFVAYAYWMKETKSFYDHEPWQDDPYDTCVSFAIFFLPVLLALCLARLPLCNEAEPLPMRRVADLLKASRILTLVMGATVLFEWASVVGGAHRELWTLSTGVSIALLAAMSLLVAGVAQALRRATLVVPVQTCSGDDDWLADSIELMRRGACALGPLRGIGEAAVTGLDRVVAQPTRRHPVLAAATVSTLFGALVATGHAWEEGGGPSVALFFTVASSGMFAFLTLLGRSLGLAGSSGGGLHPVIAGCAAVPVVLAFRNSLWWIIGTNEQDAGLTQLAILISIGATAAATWVAARKRRRG